MLSVKDFSSEQMLKAKGEILKYRKDCFPEIESKNNSLSNEKIEKICKKHGLKFLASQDKDTRKMTYNITLEEKDDEDKENGQENKSS